MSKTWSVYALIVDDVVWDIKAYATNGYEAALSVAKYDICNEAIVVDVTNITGVKAGDTYRDGSFYWTDADGVEHKREPVPSEEDRIAAVEATSTTNTSEIESNTNAIDDILVMLLDDSSTTDTDTTTEVTE